MKTRLKLIISVIILAPAFAAGVVVAHEGEEVTPTTGETSARAIHARENPDEKLTLQQRVEKRKTDLKLQVSNTEKQRIAQRCKASQGSISSLKGRITGIETSRTNVYGKLNVRLNELAEKLKKQGIDTTKLEADLATYAAKIEAFYTDLDAYRLAVSDLAEMQCAQDPDAFKASLEAARTAREKVSADATDIKAFIKDTLKPTLQDTRKQLDEKNNEGTN